MFRCRLSWRDPLFALLMEFADPIMMRRTLLNIRERAESLTRSEDAESPNAGSDSTECAS